ncbi:MAG: ATP-binding protein [Leptospiraceae bacterium]|nr:ATP-binding protein [Leptospiraceae bacterium]
MDKKGTLIFFCGKMGAGKSTYAKNLSEELNAIFLSEDEWLSALFPEEIKNFDDYIKYSSRLKPLLKVHVTKILNSGISVVMDFPGNTKKQRDWFKQIFLKDKIPHKIIYLKADDELCLKRIEQRREISPERSKFDTKEVFLHVTSYFQPPEKNEELNIEIVVQEDL